MNSITVTRDGIHYIKRIDFDIYTNNITCESVMSDPVGIIIGELYNIGNRRYDRIIDTRINVFKFLLECPLCGETALKCPGHFGHIRLEEQEN